MQMSVITLDDAEVDDRYFDLTIKVRDLYIFLVVKGGKKVKKKSVVDVQRP